MLHLNRVRELNLQAPTAPGRPAWLSAASGLVQVGEHLYVVADDELQLGMFSVEPNPGQLLRLLPGELPDGLKKRKKHKPDFEILLYLPPFATYRDGALLAMGSGSRRRRCQGVLLALDAQGVVHEAPIVIDMTAWFSSMQRRFADLNLEGAWVSGNTLQVLHRGNNASPNAMLQYALDAVLAGVVAGAVPALQALTIHEMQLGKINEVPLSFTDACALPDGWLFTAVAEDTDSAYADGACLGAVVGRVNAQHHIQWIKQVTPSFKLEGIEVIPCGDQLQVLMVSDADDVAVPALLLSALIDT